VSDTRLARALAGGLFSRADSRRDERQAEPWHPIENFLRNLVGWCPPKKTSDATVRRWHTTVQEHAKLMRHQTNAEVAKLFNDALEQVKRTLQPKAVDKGMLIVFACLAEVSRRQLGLVPHPVQLAGARALLSGDLIEMQTGEGKTLVAALAAAAMAGGGASVHIISTNDYLAQRDCEEMAPLFSFLGLGAACIQSEMSPEDRRLAYAQPICYASGKEVVFDYLKDSLAGHGLVPERVADLRDLVLAGTVKATPPLIPSLHFAIVDEADSVLIDEARTPMILSRAAPPVFDPALLDWAISAARQMKEGQHFRIGSGRELDLLPCALTVAPPLPADIGAVWQTPTWREHLLRQALSALHLYLRDQHYILDKDKVQIVDENTGRVMSDRSWEQGLHQLIETKEGLPLTAGRETLARMTYQRFFRRYYLVSGLTGTAAEASRELWLAYRLRVRRLPPNRPTQRRRLANRCEPDLIAKWSAVSDAACLAAARGQPVLIGTRSVEASEQISAELHRRAVAHVVLNARQDAEEAHVIAMAGQSGRITVATNMAGRGTDIKPDAAACAAGGLHVILTEFHESPRVDRQLFGRSGRQGQLGSYQAIVSARDPLFERQPQVIRWLLAGRASNWILPWVVRLAQGAAERKARRVRLQTMKQDRELNRMIGFAGRAT
jgi:preprotein translocase subunit SecA